VKYRTIVADPPWPIGDFPAWFDEDRRSRKERELGTNVTPYQTMSLDAIKAIPVRDLSEADRWHVEGARGGCNLFLWATTEHLEAAYDVVRTWAFVPKALLVWCKPHRPGGLGGTFKANVEFVIVARRGSPPRATGSAPTRWFTWPLGRHSEKPAAFYDLVEDVSVGPRLELFARRQRLGWDTWGNEALEHVQIEAT
jgi:N6-adenosine-specific RNA methylase IME4